jgi:hypothetical protein
MICPARETRFATDARPTASILDPEQSPARRDGIKVNCAGVVAMV